MNFLKTLALLCAFLAAVLPDALHAQGISDLGVVWSKTYGSGTISNIKPNLDGTYTACGYPWIDGVSSKLDRLTGLVVEFDESGSMLWRATVQIPQSYIDNHTGNAIDTYAYAWFEVAFKTDDGGRLAFGRFVNRGAPANEKQPNWDSNPSGSQYLTEGFWIVKFNVAGEVERNELVRGLWAIDGWRTSDDNFVVGGFDVSYRGTSGSSADSITLLRKYDQNGDTIKTNKANYREITAIYKYPGSDGFIAVTPDRFLRIDENLNITAKLFSALGFPRVTVPSSGMITPTKENGGVFIPVILLSSTNAATRYQNGFGFYKVNASDQLQYYRTWIPHDTIVSAPLLLPGNSDPAKYVGTATRYNTSGIATAIRMYELTDNTATSTLDFVLGDPYPSGTTLKTVSQVDGFFSCGTADGQAAIAKLSTCANFTIDAGAGLTLRTAGKIVLPARTIAYNGNAGTVTGSWTLADITPGGVATNLAQPVSVSGSLTIPAQTVTLQPGKTSARLQYTATAVDSYMTGDVPQTCQQTQSVIIDLVYDVPDNVSDAECFVDIPAISWNIQKAFESASSTKMTAYTAPLVGDLNNDGIPEVIVYNYLNSSDPRTVDSVHVFWGHDRANPTRFKIPTTSYMHPMGALARVEIGGALTPMLVFQATDGYLYAYNPATGQPISTWNGGSVAGRSDAQVNDWSSASAVNAQAVGFTDFDGDGFVEIYASCSVWAAENGKLLVRGAGNKGYVLAGSGTYKHYYTVAADFDDDGITELAAGTQVYDVHTPYRDGLDATNTMAIKYQLPNAPTVNGVPMTDGTTIVADINRDGQLDVVVSNNTTAYGRPYGLLVWDPRRQTVIATGGGVGTDYPAVPFAGNIDADPNMEILYIVNTRLDGWRYDGTTTLQRPYQMTHTDGSGATGITMFDFNSDKIPELVYRDQDNLRIMQADAATSTITNRNDPIACGSGTYKEYPVVADVDGDGSAAILVMGGASGAVSPATLRIYKSAGAPWAPARKVWNQYMYNAVNINEDLTVPRYQFNPASVFPGEDGQLNGTGDVQPFNAFLQQQTSLSRNGTPYWLTPRAAKLPAPEFDYYAAADSLTVRLQVANIGNAPFAAPFYVTMYKDAVASSSKKITYAYPHVIAVGETATIEIGVSRFKANGWGDFAGLIVRTNDRGDTYTAQTVCDSTLIDRDFRTLAVIAVDDYVMTPRNSDDFPIEPALNDLVGNVAATLAITTGGQPKHGVASLAGGNVISYTPAQDYVGKDTITYRLYYSDGQQTLADTARIFISVVDYPDNIREANCYVEPESFEWSIREEFKSRETNLSTYMTPMVGDLDGDGIPEIVAAKYDSDNTPLRLYYGFYIYWGHDRENPTRIYTEYGNFTSFGPAIARIVVAPGDTVSMIVMAKASADAFNSTLFAYNALTGAEVWHADAPVFASVPPRVGYSMQFVDFNANGTVELVVANKIYDAATGKLLLDMGASNKGYSLHVSAASHPKYVPAVGDFDGDGRPDYAAGNQVYTIDITNNGGTAGNSATLLSSVPAQRFGTYDMTDGTTLAADFNGDGRLDVFTSTGKEVDDVITFFAWDVQTQTVIARGSTTSSNYHTHGAPFVGNVDTIPGLEILFTTQNKIQGFRCNTVNASFDQVYDYDVTDDSGTTGITLFDFNQDGKSELVYRDGKYLRILQAVPAVAPALGTFSPLYEQLGGSGTCYEYPVIADVDNDGGAEIVTVSGGDNSNVGSLRIYKSNDPVYHWAAARKVWNQYSYNPVYVNEDLTVPQYPLNPATFFPGKDGVLHTADDIQPYNNFLQQQTVLAQDGVPFFLAANANVVGVDSIHYSVDGDSLQIFIEISNTGDAGLQEPFYISTYKDEVAAANHIALDSSLTTLNPGASQIVRLTVRNLATHQPFDDLIFQVNDLGDGQPVQQECSTAQNFSSPLPLANLLQAQHDYVAIVAGGEAYLLAMANDSIPSGCTPRLTVRYDAKHGNVGVLQVGALDTVVYVPKDNNFVGRDSFSYYIECGANRSDAKIYVYVGENPDNIGAATCYIEPPATDWSIRELPLNASDQLHNFSALTVGNLDGNDTTLIIGFLDYHGADVTAHSYQTHGLKIFYFDRTGQRVKLKRTIPFKDEYGGDFYASSISAMAIARYNGKGYIVVPRNHSSELYLYAYDTHGNLHWRSSATYTADIANGFATIVNIADFNGDGIPEVYAGNRIFSLATGAMLCSGGDANNTGVLYHSGGDASIAADVVPNIGGLELCAGTQIYRVDIPQGATTAGSGSMSVIADMTLPAPEIPSNASADGATQVVDIDGDGILEVVVVTRQSAATGHPVVVYVWKPLPAGASYLLGSFTTPHNSDYYSLPMIGNIDNTDPHPEIVYIGDPAHMYALEYVPAAVPGNRLVQKWQFAIDDGSAATGMALFDFNNDHVSEIVYRDEHSLYIIDGNTTTPHTEAVFTDVYSYTLRESPVVADVDGDGQAEIVVTGGLNNTTQMYNGYVRVFKSNGSPWAPARKVWNQYSYNAACVNDDLTVPAFPLYTATVFAGKDGLTGTADDVQPYNDYRRQQTVLNRDGYPLWPAADAVFDATHLSAAHALTSAGLDSASISLCIVNAGDAAIGSPVYASIYRENCDDPANYIATDSIVGVFQAGDTACLTVGVGDIRPYLPFTQLVVRLNDRNGVYPWQEECNCGDSVRALVNPALTLMMTKRATLNGEQHNGMYANPVSVFFSEKITYEITAYNANVQAGTVVIRDTLPPYMNYDGAPSPGDAAPTNYGTTASGYPPRDTVVWVFAGVPPKDTRTVRFEATPVSGASASQPLFANRAWALTSDTLLTPTNSTYHQGAGLSLVTFSASAGGNLYNADRQAVDYNTTPRAGVLVAPDEGYRFAGWSHEAYISPRGAYIPPVAGIERYDTLTIYGNVNLHARFEPVPYPIRYLLHGGENAPANPSSYTIEDATITLAPPEKAGDVFIGWTDASASALAGRTDASAAAFADRTAASASALAGRTDTSASALADRTGTSADAPQKIVTIPAGSTGERTYYANYLYSGREAVVPSPSETGDAIWVVAGELYVRTSRAGSIVRIYTPDGVLRRRHTVLAPGLTKLPLAEGVYIVTLNNGAGWKVISY